MEPLVPELRRTPSGWLALSPSDDPIRIGVVGDTEAEARANYVKRRSYWEELRLRPLPESCRPDEQ
jgi:hypothetical protein